MIICVDVVTNILPCFGARVCSSESESSLVSISPLLVLLFSCSISLLQICSSLLTLLLRLLILQQVTVIIVPTIRNAPKVAHGTHSAVSYTHLTLPTIA